jgi:hypothetical protein
LEGEIENSDADSVYVRAENGALYRVPRAGVLHIDHPGNVALTIGIVLLGWAAGMAIAPSTDEGRNRDDALPADFGNKVGIFMLGVPGAILALYGGVTWGLSVASANHFKDPALSPYVLPKQSPVPTSVLGSPLQKPALGNEAPVPNPPEPLPTE